MLMLFLLTVTGAALGLIGLLRLATGREALPTRRPRPVRTRRWPWLTPKLVAAAAIATVTVAVLTRWPVAAAVTGALVLLGPRLFTGAATEKASLAKLEAIVVWTESLRDVYAAADGLNTAIARTVDRGAPSVLARPLRNLAADLNNWVPMRTALHRFADDVEDAGADLVVAALLLTAEQRAGSLSRVLTVLVANLRSELEMRTKVLHRRRSIRNEARLIALLGAGCTIAQLLYTPTIRQAYQSGAGQALFAAVAVAFLMLVVRMQRLAIPEPTPRFLDPAAGVGTGVVPA